MRGFDLFDNRLEFFADGTIDLVVLVDALDRQVGRHLEHFEAVDVAEFLRFRRRSTGHPGQLVVHAEIVLEGDRGECLVLGLDLHLLLGFECLVLPFGVAAARHHATGKLVDDDDLAVSHDIVLVAREQFVGLERVVDVVNDRHVLDVVERLAFQQARLTQHVFEFLGAVLREVGRALLFVDLVVFRRQARNELVDGVVEVGTVVKRPGDDERRACFVHQNRVHFVDDREEVAALHHLGAFVLHVVAQIIEAELVVRRIGDVAGIGVAALLVGEAVDDNACGHAEEAVDAAHHAGVALGEVIVDGDHVHTLAGERVEIDGKGGDERLAFAGLHFRDGALVQDHAANQLDVEGAQPEDAARSLAHDCKGRHENVVQ